MKRIVVAVVAALIGSTLLIGGGAQADSTLPTVALHSYSQLTGMTQEGFATCGTVDANGNYHPPVAPQAVADEIKTELAQVVNSPTRGGLYNTVISGYTGNGQPEVVRSHWFLSRSPQGYTVWDVTYHYDFWGPASAKNCSGSWTHYTYVG